VLGLAVAVCVARAVQAGEGPGVDELFQQARSLAFAGQREEARELCREILARSPDYTDVKVLLGRLHAWDGEYDVARGILAEAVASRPTHADARHALVDVELWSDRPLEALRLAEAGLELDPDDPELLYRKARALDRLERQDEAYDALQRTLEIEPERRDARRALRRLLDERLRNRIEVNYELEDVEDLEQEWHEASVEYRRKFSRGSVLGRVNYAERFGENGHQYEIDAYPELARRTYLYLNLGYSSTELFPELRYAAEVFHNFPHGYEGSLGFRRLEFENSAVTIYTGSAAKYVGHYWIALRPYYVDKQDGHSTSLGLTVRRFLNGRYEYVEVGVSGGTEDEEFPVAGATAAIAAREEESLNSFTARAELRKRVTDTVIVIGGIRYRTEDLDPDRSRDSVTFRVGVAKYF
jgi:YaiO family outer membrane protein